MAEDHKRPVNAKALRALADEIEAHLGTEATVEVRIRRSDFLRLLDKGAENHKEMSEGYLSLLAKAREESNDS